MVEKTWILKATVPDGTKAGSVVTVTFKLDPSLGETSVVEVDKGKVYKIKDIYIMDTQPVNGVLKIFEGTYDKLRLSSDPINTLVQSNNMKPRYSPLPFPENTKITAQFVLLEDYTPGTGTPAEITIYAKVDEVPATKSTGARGIIAKLKSLLK